MFVLMMFWTMFGDMWNLSDTVRQLVVVSLLWWPCCCVSSVRTKWKRQSAVGLELLAEASRMFLPSHFLYPPAPPTLDLYLYRNNLPHHHHHQQVPPLLPRVLTHMEPHQRWQQIVFLVQRNKEYWLFKWIWEVSWMNSWDLTWPLPRRWRSQVSGQIQKSSLWLLTDWIFQQLKKLGTELWGCQVQDWNVDTKLWISEVLLVVSVI